MNLFKDQIVVITGAASGIGRAIARKAALLGMRIVLADVEREPLNELNQELELAQIQTITMVTDVRDSRHLQALAKKTQQVFGVPDYLFNNAGVGGPMHMAWENPIEKIRWVMDVNFYGMVNGVQAFLPAMLQANKPAYIINTASMAGFYTAPYLSAYEAAKHAVVAWTEALYHDLKTRNSAVRVLLLSPGWVKTNILNDTRNFEQNHHTPIDFDQYTDADAHWICSFARAVKKGIHPNEVAEQVFEAILQERFYVFTHPEMKHNIQNRLNAILEEQPPAELKW